MLLFPQMVLCCLNPSAATPDFSPAAPILRTTAPNPNPAGPGPGTEMGITNFKFLENPINDFL